MSTNATTRQRTNLPIALRYAIPVDVQKLTEMFYHRRSCWIDGSSQFTNLVRSYLRPEFLCLDLAAGSSKEGPVNFRGEVRNVVGIDCESYIRDNLSVDDGVIALAEDLPFRPGSFEMVVSDWALEHFAEPEAIASEIFRVLKPTGLFAFRTGNVWHYSYAIAAATPHWFHKLVADKVRGISPGEHAPHVTHYRMNTQKAVRECLGRVGFIKRKLVMMEPEPSYLMFSVPSFLVGLAYERIVNRVRALAGFRACILGVFEKP